MPSSQRTKRGMPPKRPARIDERRESSRRLVLYPAYLLFMQRRFRCRLVEISANGICLAGCPPLKVGTPVMIETLLLGKRAGVVAHGSGNKLGIALFGAPLKKRGQRMEGDDDDS